ncbi:dihydrofolate reductase family protein [Niabella hibiscisoli]|uniref:dihydrofolate reductase family protein n=1 Tax=Niabella hibiscisoli TaxID=1825928 RepID=UPI001F10E4C7|nr:dihydrofolate reductase family protein [Niabella hibiscisoli]MCH5718461.1 dihydrofolate reductase family protein [Niabella hibiscisoli]
MSRIFVSNWISLDGIFSGRGGDTGWFTSDEELMHFNLEQLNQADTILMGRTTFDLMVGYWPGIEASRDFADAYKLMNESRKHIFSKTVRDSDWQNCFFHDDINEEVISHIKASTHKNIVILGSGVVSTQLQAIGLIDGYHILLDPQIKGEGRRFFDAKHCPKLKLENAKKFDCGVVYLQYSVVK